MSKSQSKYPSELSDYFTIGDTIGAGGFAKVKKARHKLTKEKVAIKIMDKAALRETDDLERVSLEIKALKQLSHQNISRLYMIHETETKFYLVLEYAVGGELFDYIVTREKCKEDEARVFFQQIASAVAFCHQHGIAHRDLKPENLLLDAQGRIKLIDFGLIAIPNDLATNVLSTCCGSAAYAAPELIRGEKYLGQPADMWSLGILLYALLCGFLPFDDDNTQRLYRLIQRGTYEIPPWLSERSQQLIGQLLKHEPASRLTMEQLLCHPWLLKDTGKKRIDPSSKMGDLDNLVPEVVAELSRFHGLSTAQMQASIKEWKYDSLTCNYEILKEMFAKNKMPKLPTRRSEMDPDKASQLVRLQQIQQRSEMSLMGVDPNRQRTGSTPADLGAQVLLSRIMGGPPMSRTAVDGEGLKPLSEQIRSMSMNGEGGPNDLSKIGGSLHQHVNQLSTDNKYNVTHSSANAGLNTLGRDSKKQSGSVRSLFGSVGSLFGFGGSRDNLSQPRKLKGLFNAETTSTKDVSYVMDEVNRVLVNNGFEVKKKGFVLKGKFFDPNNKNKNTLSINLEVCTIDKTDMRGIKLTRVRGDTWAYKKVTDKLLSDMKL
eukprot:m.185823 g.185823  ORF g.185823 m.185823 type:complete len:601 (-) comp32245_c0_seq1:436-2238(-)